MADEHTHTIELDDLPEEARQIAELIGIEALMKLSAAMGGERIYIPLPERLSVSARNRAIRADFNGRNLRELATRHGLTPRWVRAIVAGENSDEEERTCREGIYKQAKLF